MQIDKEKKKRPNVLKSIEDYCEDYKMTTNTGKTEITQTIYDKQFTPLSEKIIIAAKL